MVSVIIPAYNAEKTIKRCVESVCKQKYNDLEIIIVDDGSKDGTFEIIEKLAEHDERIIPIKTTNKGPSNARNIGLEMASGEFIRFVDADDFIKNDSIEQLVIEQKTYDADLVIGGYNTYSHGMIDGLVQPRKGLYERKDFQCIEWYCEKILGALWNKLFKTKFIKKYFEGKYKVGEDLLFVLNYIKGISLISIISEPIYEYEYPINSRNLSLRYHDTNLDAIVECWTILSQDIGGDFNTIRNEFYRLALMNHLKMVQAGVSEYKQKMELNKIRSFVVELLDFQPKNLPIQYKPFPLLLKNEKYTIIRLYMTLLSKVKKKR